MHVSSQPYVKTYSFPLLSMTTLLKLTFLVLTIALPFFLTYSTPNFYLSSHLQVNTTQPISFLYKYHIAISTDSSTFIYTNVATNYEQKAISIHQTASNGIVEFGLQWPKQKPADRVMRVDITLLFNYDYAGSKQFGLVSGTVEGYNIAEGSIAGVLVLHRGNGNTNITEQNFILNSYNPQTTYAQMLQSTSYLTYESSSIPINMPSDLLQVKMVVNCASYLTAQTTPSILGQLVWSWVQYFPIFLSLYWLVDRIFCFLLKEQILKRKITHDQDYLHLVQEENNRRERLRLV